jgi:hypothetical protein
MHIPSASTTKLKARKLQNVFPTGFETVESMNASILNGGYKASV